MLQNVMAMWFLLLQQPELNDEGHIGPGGVSSILHFKLSNLRI